MCGDKGGGSSGGKGADADQADNAKSTGNYSGAATGHGKDGYGDITDGKPGLFSSDLTEEDYDEEMADFAAKNAANAYSQSDNQAVENEAQVGVSGPGLNTTGEESQYALDVLAQNKMLQTNPDLTNSIFSNPNFEDKASYAQEAYSLPSVVNFALDMFSPIKMNVVNAVAAQLAAWTGKLVDDQGDTSLTANGPGITDDQYRELEDEYGVSSDQVDEIYQAMTTDEGILENEDTDVGILSPPSFTTKER